MEAFSVKEYLCLEMPTEDMPLSDHRRIELALADLGYAPVIFPLPVLRRLYPLCRDAGFAITVTLVRRLTDWVVTDVQAGDQRGNHYGLAVDYGSTTILMQLVDLRSGVVIGEEKSVNGQVEYGTDILSRITFSMADSDNWEQLQRATVQTFDQLLSRMTEATGIDVGSCPIMVISGNTTMIHFLLGLHGWPVFAAPFAPISSDPGFFWGRELGMDFQGLVCILPAASNYVGGDIVSGLLSLGLHRSEDPAMFFDIGTNGELVIGCKDWLIAGAGAAGPALEGYISRFGMRAAKGAVDSVSIQKDRMTVTTIGGEKPVGICGSGIIDLLAQMRLNGWINIAGELEPGASQRIVYLEDEGQYVVIYAFDWESASGSPLYFSQTDIMQYLDTKAAAYTMVDCLLEAAGISADSLARCYLSGAFSAHSNLDAAITIGIFPDLPRQRYVVEANTSLDGARKVLLDHGLLREASTLAESIHCVQFASIPDFLVRMQAAKFIPHTDMSRYPTVEAALRNKK